VVALLGLPEPHRFARYEVRIEPPAGAGPAAVLEIEPGPDGVLAVEMGIDRAPGVYRLVLYGLRAGEREELASYALRLAGRP
jgi:hypothetical protein